MLKKRINDLKDVNYFKTQSPAYKNITSYIDLLCKRINGTGSKVFNHKYAFSDEIFKQCGEFLDELEKCCQDTDLNLVKTAATLRFGHVAFRDWFDVMRARSEKFIKDDLASNYNDQFKEELVSYLSESFGNKMRIDYGTGHELNFIIFTMGLSNLVKLPADDQSNLEVTQDKLQAFVEAYGFDVLSLFAHKYLRLCRKIQTKFRLEPAGSRGVYNMDDFQFLPFLFGAAQLNGIKYIPTSNFYQPDQVDMFKNDYILFEAVDFILNNKRGPFNEHSYTLWGFTNLGSWENIFRRIRLKFTDDILGPFPIIQHFLFGAYILRWSESRDEEET